MEIIEPQPGPSRPTYTPRSYKTRIASLAAQISELEDSACIATNKDGDNEEIATLQGKLNVLSDITLIEEAKRKTQKKMSKRPVKEEVTSEEDDEEDEACADGDDEEESSPEQKQRKTIGSKIKKSAAKKKTKKNYDSEASSSEEEWRQTLFGSSTCTKCEKDFLDNDRSDRKRCFDCPAYFHLRCLPPDVQAQFNNGQSWEEIGYVCDYCHLGQ